MIGFVSLHLYMCAALASSNQAATVQVIAKEVVNSNKAINRLTTQKAHMMDMGMALKHQLGATLGRSLPAHYILLLFMWITPSIASVPTIPNKDT